MDNETRIAIEERIIDMLKTVYDPEIPVNVYDLGLIYKIDVQEDAEVVIDMTLTFVRKLSLLKELKVHR